MLGDSRRTIQIYWMHTWRYKAVFLCLMATVILSPFISVIVPLTMRELVNSLVNKTAWRGISPTGWVWVMLGLGVVAQMNYRATGYLINFLQPRVMADLYMTCYKYVTNHSYTFFVNNFIGALVTKIRRYQAAYERVTDSVFFELSQTILRIVFVQVAIFATLHVYIGLMALAWIFVYAGFASWFVSIKMPYDLRLAGQDTKTTAHVADTLTNFLNLKLYGSWSREVKKFQKITDELFAMRKKSWDLSNHANVFQGGSMLILEFATMYFAVSRVQSGRMSVGELVMLQGYLVVIMERMWNLTRHLKSLYEGLADANEMTTLLVQPHEVVDCREALELQVTRAEISFRNVGFYYHDEATIFSGFDLHIRSGEKVALVGKSGSGKSTAVKLLLRMKDIHEGNIMIDGQNICQVTQNSLRKAIAFVPQEPVLFHRSLMENIRYGRPDASDEEVIEAAKSASAHEFIVRFSQGYDTLVGERGVKLSGGERQRVAIARAFLQNAPILVLDEATSSLDSISEHYIQEAMDRLMKHRTSIVIAHRLSTVRKMDRIVVLDEGQIIEMGDHEELLANNGAYSRFWNMQVGGFAMIGGE